MWVGSVAEVGAQPVYVALRMGLEPKIQRVARIGEQ